MDSQQLGRARLATTPSVYTRVLLPNDGLRIAAGTVRDSSIDRQERWNRSRASAVEEDVSVFLKQTLSLVAVPPHSS
jgi:hypothetical protein